MAVNPFLALESIVTKIKTISGVTALVPTANIYAYLDGYPLRTKLSNAIHDAPVPCIMAYYRGTTPARGQRETVSHQFSLAIKGSSAADFGAIFTALLNGTPTGSTVPFRLSDLYAGLQPMDSYPSVTRSTVVTDMTTGEYIEFFDVQFSATER